MTSGKMGWVPDYSLHPIQWNFSGMEGAEPPLAPVRLSVIKLGRFGYLGHFGTSLTGNQWWTPACVFCKVNSNL